MIAATAFPLLLLDPADNVLVCGASVRQGDLLTLDGRTFAAPADVALGHKLARTDLESGETVIKYGAPIGTVTAPVRRGEHVHSHNMRSNYIPTHTREAVGQ